MNRILVITLLMISIFFLSFMCFFIYQTIAKDTGESEENHVEVEENKNHNEYYVIANNPTEYQQALFDELTMALEANNTQSIAESVVKSFICDYYTWTNKDSNYEVGGMDYIYKDYVSNFAKYSRENIYAYLHDYIKQYGRDEILEVNQVSISSASPMTYELIIKDEKTQDVAIHSNSNLQEVKEDEIIPLEAYTIHANWSFASHQMPTSEIIQEGEFVVVNHDGRWEIVEMRVGNTIEEEDVAQ